MYGGIAYGSAVDKDYGWTDLTGTLQAGETTLTIQHEIITPDVTVEPYSDPFGISPTDMVVTNGQVVLTFNAQPNNVEIMVRVSKTHKITPDYEWYGTPSEYRALASKSDDTLYKTLFDNKIPSADFIGNNQISPVNIDFADYDIVVSRFSPNNYIYDTGYQWYNNNLEMRFSLHEASYSGTQVLFSNGSGSPDFNLILNGTQMRIYTTNYNQTVIDTIQADTEYIYHKENGLITISRGDTELFSTTQTTVNTSTINLFGWRNGYYTEGIVNYLTIKTLT